MPNNPLYQAVYNDLKNKLVSETYPIGTLIPTESELEKSYNVSRTTIRKAISLLVNEGLLVVKQGYGTEVRGFSTTQTLSKITSVSETLRQQGHVVTVRDLHIEKITPPDNVRDILELSDRDFVIKIDRILCVDSFPMSYVTNYLVSKLIPDFDISTDLANGLYHELEYNYNVVMTSAEEIISARRISFTESLILQVSIDTPVLVSERTTYVKQSIPFEYATSRFVADKYKYHIYMQGR